MILNLHCFPIVPGTLTVTGWGRQKRFHFEIVRTWNPYFMIRQRSSFAEKYISWLSFTRFQAGFRKGWKTFRRWFPCKEKVASLWSVAVVGCCAYRGVVVGGWRGCSCTFLLNLWIEHFFSDDMTWNCQGTCVMEALRSHNLKTDSPVRVFSARFDKGFIVCRLCVIAVQLLEMWSLCSSW